MVIKTKFEFGDIVYIGHDPKQRGYEVVGIFASPGSIMVQIDYLGDTVDMYDFQLSHEKDVLKFITSDENEED